MATLIPEEKSSAANKTKVMFAAFFAGGFVIGLLLMFALGPHAKNKELSAENEIMKEYLRANVFFFEELAGEEMEGERVPRSISGSVESINNNIIKLDTGISDVEVLVTGNPRVYDVVVSEDTTIILRREKDHQLHQEELEEYERAIATFEDEMMEDADFEATNYPEYPRSYEELTATLSDIEQRTRIDVTTSQDIENARVSADEIVLHEFIDEDMGDDEDMHEHEDTE